MSLSSTPSTILSNLYGREAGYSLIRYARLGVEQNLVSLFTLPYFFILSSMLIAI